MLPAIALLITIYGSCRLANDVLKRVLPGNDTQGQRTAAALTGLVFLVGLIALWSVYGSIDQAARQSSSLGQLGQ